MKRPEFIEIAGGITAAKGVLAAGIACGIKKTGAKDLALIVSEEPASVAAIFTTNRVQAASVLLCRQTLKKGVLGAVVVNSGNANACTGPQGLADAKRMQTETAKALKISWGQVFVASTGVIGQRLPLKDIVKGIPKAAKLLSRRGGADAAEAIMTTDAFSKSAALKVVTRQGEYVIGGIAKGAGMICPQMATMLAFIATDADISTRPLQKALSYAVDHSFNCITVDGDTSTNDTVLAFANGAGGVKIKSEKEQETFTLALQKVTAKLAKMIVRDGEGATKLLEIKVKGARSLQEARGAAKAVANSLLVKTAFFGEDLNWGRIMAALGYSGARFNPHKVDISISGVPVVKRGLSMGSAAEKKAAPGLKKKEILLDINLHSGLREATIWGCDLSLDYVKINASYRS
jgi:glutamate N-acetyltransferase/amino-acid N-acetyltransferase